MKTLKFLSIELSIILVLPICIYSLLSDGIVAHADERDTPLPSVLATASINKGKITIGENIRYTIRLEYDPQLEVISPGFSERLADLTITDSGRTEPRRLDNGRLVREEWWLLETFSTGSYVIPSVTIRYREADGEMKEVATSELFVEVKSVAKEGEALNDIREIREPRDVPISYSRIYLIAGGVLGLLAIIGAILFVIRKRRGKDREPEPIPRPAHEVAYEELEALLKLDLVSKGMVKEYYYRLSNIVRLYIEKRFDIMAPERTTEEFLAEMASANSLRVEHKQLIGGFLNHCDLVKFAKYGPQKDEVNAAYNAARRLIDETNEEGRRPKAEG